MSYNSWHIYGYGLCVSDIEGLSTEKIQALLATMSLTLKGRGKNALLKGSYPSYNEGVIGLTGHCLSFYASQAFCQTAPVTTDVAVLSGHYQLVDAYIQCLTKERRLGQPADQNLKAKRQTASETLDKVVLDCRKRFSSFTPTDQNQYRKGVSSLINTVLPVWLKLRNTYINISK